MIIDIHKSNLDGAGKHGLTSVSKKIIFLLKV
jgi:hypothetical protein